MDALANLRELSSFFENPWIQSLGIFILSLVLTVLIRWSLRFISLTVVQKTKTEVDDIVILAVRRLVNYSVPVIGLMVALKPLALTTSMPQRTLFSLLAVLVIRGAVSLAEDLSQWMGKAWVKRTDATLEDGLLPLVRKTVKTSIVILGVLVILQQWEVQIGPILGALGIGGLAIGLALNSSLANIFGGIQLLLDGSLNTGDKVMLESGEVGEVLDVGLRCTKLRTYDNEVIFLPNSQLANSRIKNFTRPDVSIKVSVNFGVAYGSDVARVKQVVLDAIRELDDILQEPAPQVLFLHMGDFSLDLCVQVWVDHYGKQFARKLEITELIYITLNESGIEIPFPTRTLYMKQ